MKTKTDHLFFGGNFGKPSEEKSIFRSHFSSNWKERSSQFFDLYLMKMKQNFEPDIHFEADALSGCIFAGVWELFEWIKAYFFGTIFLDKILFVNVSS